MEIAKVPELDLLESNHPALSATSDMPVIETKPDASPSEVKAEAVPPEPEVEDGEAEPSEESATPATETPGQPAPSTPRGVGKKIAELVKQREEAVRRENLEREEKLRLLAIIEASKKPPEPSDEPVRPAKADFPDPDAWDEALMQYAEAKAVWTAKREVQVLRDEETRKTHETAVAEGQKIALENYNSRKEKTKEKYADFEEVANSPDVKVSMPVAHAIIHSENGPELQYYLGKHPEEAERLSAMTVTQFNPQTRTMDSVPDVARQLLELGLIVGKINTPAPKAPITSAPRPLKPLKGGDSAPVKNLAEMSMDEYAKARRSH